MNTLLLFAADTQPMQFAIDLGQAKPILAMLGIAVGVYLMFGEQIRSGLANIWNADIVKPGDGSGDTTIAKQGVPAGLKKHVDSILAASPLASEELQLQYLRCELTDNEVLRAEMARFVAEKSPTLNEVANV